MEIKKANTIIKSLTSKGYEASIIKLTGDRIAVKVLFDYEGLYPGKYQFDTLDYLRKTYSKKYTVEKRGYYQAAFIY